MFSVVKRLLSASMWQRSNAEQKTENENWLEKVDFDQKSADVVPVTYHCRRHANEPVNSRRWCLKLQPTPWAPRHTSEFVWVNVPSRASTSRDQLKPSQMGFGCELQYRMCKRTRTRTRQIVYKNNATRWTENPQRQVLDVSWTSIYRCMTTSRRQSWLAILWWQNTRRRARFHSPLFFISVKALQINVSITSYIFLLHFNHSWKKWSSPTAYSSRPKSPQPMVFAFPEDHSSVCFKSRNYLRPKLFEFITLFWLP